MDRCLDPHMQRILNDAANSTAQNDQAHGFDYDSGPADRRPVDWNFAPAMRQAAQEPASFSPYNRVPYQQPIQQPQQQLQRLSSRKTRLSLPPKNIFAQPENKSRVLSKADNHFRFAQNLREGAPLNQPPAPRQYAVPPVDTIGRVANAMLMQYPLSLPRLTQSIPPPRILEPDMANLFSGHGHSKLGQLQPQKQQITPPFNLSGYTYSPEGRQSLSSSSPLAGQASSPTTRVSLQRNAARPTPSASCGQSQTIVRHEDDVFSREEISMPRTPVRQTPRPMEYERPRPLPIPSTHTPHGRATNSAGRTQTLALTHAPPMAHGIQLISPYELPDRFRHVFPYELFNAAQSKCFAPIYKSNENVVVSAPTGSGKTAILELAICKIVEGYQSGTFKIIYLAPIKSLCSERLRDWTKKFSHLNLPCAELTGDTTQGEMRKVRDASIIVTTPEKWDSITRKLTDHAKLVQMVKLFLIDEVHILKDPRGATLEAIVSRMKKMSANVRFVALSATIPNSQDVATWLGKDHTSQHLPAHRETFGEDFRPVKLQRHVHGFDGMMNDFAFEKVLDGKLPGLIQKYTHKKPIIVFCYTRKSSEQTAVVLAEWWSRQRNPDRAWPAPKQKVNVGSKDLRDLLDCGVAFHHAGLDVQDRHAVETGFLGGTISVICCTSTLAVGVNLPCHLVVLKGTVGYQDGKLVEYSDLEVMQMLGRAGRPQFDDSAVAVIMSRSDKVERYKRMISGQDTLESTLHLNFIELLNSEISLGTVKNIYEAKLWLNGTFLSVRMRQNPQYYSIDGVDAGGDTDQRLEQACERDIKLLQEYNLVTNKDRFGCSEYGEAMSRYMVKFETMKLLLSIPPKAKTEQILEVVCQAIEFKDLKMKPNERHFLREFNKSPFIKFPVKETVTTTAHKVSLMIQAQLGGIEHPNEKEFNIIKRQFVIDTSMILERMQRLMRCIIDCKSFDEDAIGTRHALDLARSLAAGFWEYSNLQLRQIPDIGAAAVRKFVGSNISSVEKLDEKEAADIERILSRNPPFGRKVKGNLADFPRLELRSEIVGKTPFTQGAKPKVNVKAVLGYKGVKTPQWNHKKPSLTFMAETSGGRLVHFWRGNVMNLDKGFGLRFTVELASAGEEVKCWIACDEIVGTVKASSIKHNIPASHFPPPSAPVQKDACELQEGKNKVIIQASDEFGDGEFSDDELVAVVRSIEKDVTDNDLDEFADIDDLERLDPPEKSKNENREKVEARRMSNGKFSCLHACREGQLLKNGKTCRHKCCSGGLDKPPSKKRKRSIGKNGDDKASHEQGKVPSNTSTASQSKKQKASNRGLITKFKSDEQSSMELEDVEFVDLPEELPPVPYASLAPREDRKLHALHTSVQKDKDKSIRLPKQKPQFSYASSARPELPFLRTKPLRKHDFGYGDLSDDDFHTATPLAGISEKGSNSGGHDKILISKRPKSTDFFFDDDPLESLQAVMAEVEEVVIPRAGTPPLRKSFAEGVFDFSAFDDAAVDMGESSMGEKVSTSFTREPTKEPESSAIGGEETTKETSLERDIDEMKHRRITQAELLQQSVAAGTLPEWVNEFDADLINQFKDYVDFID